MKTADIPGFFANPRDLDLEDYLQADYYLECIGDPQLAAAHFCSEQSTAQWRRTDQEEDLRPRFAARVIDFKVEARLPRLSLPLSRGPGVGEGDIYALHVRIAHPHGNFGPRLPNLLSALAGEGTFFTPGVPIVKWLDLHFPNSFLARFEGPQFGLAGIRHLLHAYERPIFIGVIKPNIGLPAAALSGLGYQGWLGGLDIAKDDEMLADSPWCPLEQRALLLGQARRQAEMRTGQPKIYLANITDEVDRLVSLHDLAVRNGANAVLVNSMPLGLSAVLMLRRRAQVPIFAHFPFIAAFSRLPQYGIHSRVITKLQRLAGCDAIIMPGFGERMMTSDVEVIDNIRACLDEMGPIRPCLPVPGGSDWAGTLPQVYHRLGGSDFGFVTGRGVFGHPLGPEAGAASIRQAWDAVARGLPLEQQARDHPALAAALRAFGGHDFGDGQIQAPVGNPRS